MCPTPALPSPRPSPHQPCTPLHQAHVATPRRDGHRPLPLHLPLHLHHRTRTHTPAHTGDAMRHGQSAHSCCIDASVPMSVGIVPDRELSLRNLMTMQEAEKSAGTGADCQAIARPGTMDRKPSRCIPHALHPSRGPSTSPSAHFATLRRCSQQIPDPTPPLHLHHHDAPIRYRRCAHKYSIDDSEPISAGIVPDKELVSTDLMGTWEASAGTGASGQMAAQAR